jgi:hypothetical protein
MEKKTKEPIKKLFEVSGVNFGYSGVDIEYENGTDECHCGNNYCRCSTIVNTKVTSIKISDLVTRIAGSLKDAVDLYCIDRILHIYKVYDSDLWNVNVCSGYYGEEIKDVTLCDMVAGDIEEHLNKVLALKSLNKKIEALLDLEYGYLLPELADCHYSIKPIDKKDLDLQREHYTKLDRSVVESYIDYPYPRGIVLAKDSKYRLIDGYHRTSAVKNGSIKVFVATKNS